MTDKKYIVLIGLYVTDEVAKREWSEQDPNDALYSDVSDYLRHSIEHMVNSKIEEGYKPIGGLQIATEMVWKYHQAMIKDD